MSIRRLPSAAMLAAIVMTLAIGSQASMPQPRATAGPHGPHSLTVARRHIDITVAWEPGRDNVGVVGYTVYLDGVERGTTTPETQ